MLTKLSISGFGFSGKSAFIDYLMDYKNIKGFQNENEFDLFRIKNGLYDLRNSVCGEPWSMLRSAEALYSFEKVLINLCGGNGLRKYTTPGNNLTRLFPKLEKHGLEFISAITEFHLDIDWPFRDFNEDSINIFFRKIARKLGRPYTDRVCVSRISYEKFDFLCQQYLDLVFQDIISDDHKILILNNAFDPSEPAKFMKMLRNSKSIIVDRDPRDIYLSAFKMPKTNPGRLQVIGKSVHDFIARYKLERLTIPEAKNSDDILRLNFEDLIVSADDVHTLLEGFLGHKLREKTGTLFSAEATANNFQLWKKAENQRFSSEIKCIEEQLI